MSTLLLITSLLAAPPAPAGDGPLQRAEQAFIELQKIQFESVVKDKQIKETLNRKSQAYRAVEKECNLSATSGSAADQVAAICLLGRATEDFADMFIKAPVPDGLTPEQQDIFRMMLREKALPFENKALGYYKLAAEKATELGVTSAAARFARERYVTLLARQETMQKAKHAEPSRVETTPKDPAEEKRLASLRKKALDQAWAKAEKQGSVLPPRKMDAEKVPFVLLPPAISAEVENKVRLYGMKFEDVGKVMIGNIPVKWTQIDAVTLEIVIPKWLGLKTAKLSDVEGAWDIMITFKYKNLDPIIFHGGLWVGTRQ